MAEQSLDVAHGPAEGMVRLPNGECRRVPPGWAWLPAGDAGITRRVKAGGPAWTVKAKRGRRVIALGVWAPVVRIEEARRHFEAVRSTETYRRRRASDAKRRESRERAYHADFERAVLGFLDFAPMYRELGEAIARQVAAHATPVGSGTVARTERIPIEKRAEAAVIAWMRHQTTAYDTMRIERVKGRRREVRRMLAERSRGLLDDYRRGVPVDHTVCPLYRAVASADRPAQISSSSLRTKT